MTDARANRALKYVYDLTATNYGMGLAITAAAREFAVPRKHLAQRLNKRRAEHAKHRDAEAAGMWWNQ